MTKIKIMSENLANKIAAGEVVEKCASVVKELVENSIDAEADHIKINLKDGGLKEIKITDNGIGMESEDALLAFQRHATSKLTREDDLFFINTLGFRGEALPSIASVSEVDMITCSSKVGTHIKIKGGKLVKNEPSDARRGTVIKVSNLFYNTPARLKYLKSEQYELAQIVQYIEKLALSKPDIKFELTNNSKALIKTSGSGNLLKTIHEIYGLNVSSNMLEVKGSTDDYDMYGFICKPEILKSNRNHMTTIINGRVVKNYELNKAINDAYFRYKPDIKYPIVVLNFETDPTLIDVNIHPTKQDIKLSKTTELYEMINKTIQDKLTEELLIPNALKEESVKPDIDTIIKTNTTENRILEASLPKNLKEDIQTELDFSINEPEIKYEPIIEEPELNKDLKNMDFHVIGQAQGTYIVATTKEGLYLIDQHAAQERINYEKVMQLFEEKKIETIKPLIPITIELSTSDFLKVKRNIETLEKLGFKIEEFGINTFTIKEHPTWLKDGKEVEIINNIFETISELGDKFSQVKYNNQVIATIACKMSVRANTRLSIEAMEEILKELVLCKNPNNCAHGRPSIVKFSNYDLEKMFKRVMN
jgi:DNA mismatch repair protein MutL